MPWQECRNRCLADLQCRAYEDMPKFWGNQIIRRSCKLYSQPISYTKLGKKNHACWNAHCGFRDETTTPEPTTTVPINIDCSVQVDCIWDLDPNVGTSGDNKAPLFPGSQLQCEEYVTGLNQLVGLSGTERVQCAPWEARNSNSPPSLFNVDANTLEPQPLPGFAFHIPGGGAGTLETEADYFTDTGNCEAAATKINAAMAFSSTTFVASTDSTPPEVSVSCQAGWTSDASGSTKTYVRLLSPAVTHDIALPEFSCNSAWRQINHRLFDEHCDPDGENAHCSSTWQARYEDRSCNDVGGLTQLDCEVPIFYYGLGPRPSSDPTYPSLGSTFAPRDFVGQSGYRFGIPYGTWDNASQASAVFEWDDDAAGNPRDNVQIGYADCVGEPGCETPGQIRDTNGNSTDPIQSTDCNPNPLNGLDAWDQTCFGDLRVAHTNNGYPDNTCKCQATDCPSAMAAASPAVICTSLGTCGDPNSDISVPNVKIHRLPELNGGGFASTAAERDLQTIAADGNVFSQSYDQVCKYAKEHPIVTCLKPDKQATGIYTLCACKSSNTLVKTGLVPLCAKSNDATLADENDSNSFLFDDSPNRIDGVCDSN